MESKEILTSLGLDPEKIKTIDEFKSTIDSDWIRRDAVEKDPDLQGKIAGKSFGPVQVSYLRELKAMGVELSNEEIKEKKLSDIQKIGLTKLDELYKSKLADLEKKSGQGNDEKVKDLEKNLSDFQKKYNDLDGLHKSTLADLQLKEQNFLTEKMQEKISKHFDEKYNSTKWMSGMTDVDHEGMRAILNKLYKIDFDEKGEEILSDTNGNRIKSTKTIGAFKSLAEVIEEEAEKRNKLQKNDKRIGSGAFEYKRPNEQKLNLTDAPVVGGRVRQMNPRLL